MSMVDPTAVAPIEQAGTYNGNPLGTAAGAAPMRELTPAAIEMLSAAGDRLRTELREVFAAHDVAAQVVGMGSVLDVHFTDRLLRNYRDVMASDRKLLKRFVIGMLNEGVFLGLGV